MFCNMQVVENEKHFQLECSLYTYHINILLQVCYTNIENCANMDQEEQFIEILKNKYDKIIAVLGKYLHNSMTKWCGSNPPS